MPLFEGLGYGGEKTAVIIEIGHAFTKCGFSGENAPRCIVPSEVKRPKTGQMTSVWSTSNAEELHTLLVDFLHQLYFRHLLVNPKERRVLIVESVLCPTVFRDTFAKVLFNHYEVPSVLFAPSHLVALFTLGIPSGIVLDAGYTETFVLPVYEGIAILKAWQAIPLAGKAIHSYLEARLLESATVRTEQRQEKPLTAVLDAISENILEDIKVRCCFVTKMARARQIQAAKESKDADAEKLPTPPPGLDYPLDGGNILHIDGRLREEACEVLFDIDNEEKSVATLILDSILQCPVDMRRTLAENIVLIGGTAMLPGFKARLLAEMKALMEKPKYSEELAIKTLNFHKPPGQDNYISWLGGAIFGALEVLVSRSVSKEIYQQNNHIPDWSILTEPDEKEDRSFHKR